ncbi:MAG TPA: exodeoxyribonuclease III [Candidatus Limnocylindria bacterium]|jgi:exodeoxyribonuclease-3|nr:exodeoxyribonuclease III [Candidatus Limnocylindria bacterium]
MRLRVITCNLNGIRAAARKGFFRWVDAQEPDVICLQETKAQEHQLPPEALDLTRYTTAFVDARKKGYSGVALYARRPPVRIVRGLGMDDIDAEGRFVRMDFEGGLSVASLYVPSGTTGPARQAVKENFLDRFIAELVRMKNEGHPFIICGDYNIAHREIDVFNPARCAGVTGFLPQERAWMDDVLERVGWVDAFRVVNHAPKQFTWWSGWKGAWENNLGWRIDYQLVTPELAPAVRVASIYRDERFSDHAPVTIDYEF